MDKAPQQAHDRLDSPALVQELARKAGVSDHEVSAVLTHLGLPSILNEFSGFVASAGELALKDVRLSVRTARGVVAV